MIFVSDPVQMARGPFYVPKGRTPNRYMPHQSKREMARRVAQTARRVQP